jgi:hypothetical protein
VEIQISLRKEFDTTVLKYVLKKDPLQETDGKTQETTGSWSERGCPSCYLAYELGKPKPKTENPGGNA